MTYEATKRKQVRVYLSPVSSRQLEKIMQQIRSLSESGIVTEMLAAALEACDREGNLQFPLKFQIVKPEQTSARYELNERPTPKRK